MTKIAQMVQLVAAPGKQGELLIALREALVAARSEPGTLAYAVHTSVNSQEVLIYELYANAESHGAHSDSEATGRLRAAFANVLASPPVVVRANLGFSFGLPE